MARTKSEQSPNTAKKQGKPPMAQITFRCPVAMKEAVEDLARIARAKDVSALLNKIVGDFIVANTTRIDKFRRQAAQPLNTPTSKPEKKKKSARLESDPTTVEGGDGNAENS